MRWFDEGYFCYFLWWYYLVICEMMVCEDFKEDVVWIVL